VARREAATARARAYFLLALGESAPASERPCLLLTAGLPGTGKSEVARQLADRAGFVRVATDVERKRLAGVPEAEVDRVRLEDAYYAPEWNERVYDACYRRADSLLAEGRRVVVDGTFREARRRARFVDLARRSCARALVVVCDAPSQVVRDRLATRAESERDASDATWRVYELLAPRWEPAGEDESSIARILDTARGPEQVGADLMAMLAEAGLA
jgi:predicted kinase